MAPIDIESTPVGSRAPIFAASSDPIRLSILDQLSSEQRYGCNLQGKSSRRWVDYRLSAEAPDRIASSLPESLTGRVAP